MTMPQTASSLNGTMGLRPMTVQEGTCVACEQSVRSHIDHRGRWVGCKPARELGVKLILVPDRRYGVRPKEPGRIVGEPKSHAVPETAYVAYVALFPLGSPEVGELVSERDSDMYRLIVRLGGLLSSASSKRQSGTTRADLLKALDTERTGIVDGSLRRLRIAGLIDKVSLKY